jgi:hypothetical protein
LTSQFYTLAGDNLTQQLEVRVYPTPRETLRTIYQARIRCIFTNPDVPDEIHKICTPDLQFRIRWPGHSIMRPQSTWFQAFTPGHELIQELNWGQIGFTVHWFHIFNATEPKEKEQGDDKERNFDLKSQNDDKDDKDEKDDEFEYLYIMGEIQWDPEKFDDKTFTLSFDINSGVLMHGSRSSTMVFYNDPTTSTKTEQNVIKNNGFKKTAQNEQHKSQHFEHNLDQNQNTSQEYSGGNDQEGFKIIYNDQITAERPESPPSPNFSPQSSTSMKVSGAESINVSFLGSHLNYPNIPKGVSFQYWMKTVPFSYTTVFIEQFGWAMVSTSSQDVNSNIQCNLNGIVDTRVDLIELTGSNSGKFIIGFKIQAFNIRRTGDSTTPLQFPTGTDITIQCYGLQLASKLNYDVSPAVGIYIQVPARGETRSVNTIDTRQHYVYSAVINRPPDPSKGEDDVINQTSLFGFFALNSTNTPKYVVQPIRDMIWTGATKQLLINGSKCVSQYSRRFNITFLNFQTENPDDNFDIPNIPVQLFLEATHGGKFITGRWSVLWISNEDGSAQVVEDGLLRVFEPQITIIDHLSFYDIELKSIRYHPIDEGFYELLFTIVLECEQVRPSKTTQYSSSLVFIYDQLQVYAIDHSGSTFRSVHAASYAPNSVLDNTQMLFVMNRVNTTVETDFREVDFHWFTYRYRFRIRIVKLPLSQSWVLDDVIPKNIQTEEMFENNYQSDNLDKIEIDNEVDIPQDQHRPSLSSLLTLHQRLVDEHRNNEKKHKENNNSQNGNKHDNKKNDSKFQFPRFTRVRRSPRDSSEATRIHTDNPMFKSQFTLNNTYPAKKSQTTSHISSQSVPTSQNPNIKPSVTDDKLSGPFKWVEFSFLSEAFVFYGDFLDCYLNGQHIIPRMVQGGETVPIPSGYAVDAIGFEYVFDGHEFQPGNTFGNYDFYCLDVFAINFTKIDFNPTVHTDRDWLDPENPLSLLDPNPAGVQVYFSHHFSPQNPANWYLVGGLAEFDVNRDDIWLSLSLYTVFIMTICGIGLFFMWVYSGTQYAASGTVYRSARTKAILEQQQQQAQLQQQQSGNSIIGGGSVIGDISNARMSSSTQLGPYQRL